MKINKVLRLFISVTICLLAGLLGSIFTYKSIPTWYASLNKSVLNPPNWVFAPVWTVLYVLMGISLYLVWDKDFKGRHAQAGLLFFSIQLVLNILWSLLFFGLQSPFYALIEIVALWFMILFTIIEFYNVSKPAAFILVPYILWVSFAFFLNLSVFLLNP